jgi:hypothetical protein
LERVFGVRLCLKRPLYRLHHGPFTDNLQAYRHPAWYTALVQTAYPEQEAFSAPNSGLSPKGDSINTIIGTAWLTHPSKADSNYIDATEIFYATVIPFCKSYPDASSTHTSKGNP